MFGIIFYHPTSSNCNRVDRSKMDQDESTITNKEQTKQETISSKEGKPGQSDEVKPEKDDLETKHSKLRQAIAQAL